jgi:hypothetical protein
VAALPATATLATVSVLPAIAADSPGMRRCSHTDLSKGVAVRATGLT